MKESFSVCFTDTHITSSESLKLNVNTWVLEKQQQRVEDEMEVLQV